MQNILINNPKGKRPIIQLTVRRVEPNVWYSLNFHKHHYLTSALNPSCKCLLFEWDNQPVAFVALLNTPRKGCPYGMSISRIVILPDYQGLCLFRQIMDFCGGIVKSLSDETHKYELYIKTAHSKAILSLNRNQNWCGTSFDGKTRKDKQEKTGKYKNHLLRLSACKKYVGDKIDGYQNILLPINEMRKNKENN